MDLWIRSQQKEMLYKVNSNLTIRHNDTTNGVYFIELDSQKIAMYKTRERALEVLDEIQKVISTYNTENGNYVYEMPPDYENIELDVLKALNTDLDDDVEMG